LLALFGLAAIATIIGWSTGLFGGDATETTSSPVAVTETSSVESADPTAVATASPATAEPVATVPPTSTPAPSPTPAPTATPEPIAITSAVPFDPPPGSSAENNAASPFVFDGIVGTEWSTEVYGSANLGGLKQGVGIWVVYDSALIESITVRSATSGWQAQVYMSDQPAEALAGWGEPVATLSMSPTDAGQLTAEFAPQESGATLIWFTELASFGGGFAATLDDITFNDEPVASPADSTDETEAP